MTDYPKELWLVCKPDGIVYAYESEDEAWRTATVWFKDAPIARVTPEWKTPGEQK